MGRCCRVSARCAAGAGGAARPQSDPGERRGTSQAVGGPDHLRAGAASAQKNVHVSDFHDEREYIVDRRYLNAVTGKLAGLPDA